MSQGVLIVGGLGYIGGRLSTALEGDTSRHLRVTSRRPHANAKGSRKVELVALDPFGSEDQLRSACSGISCLIHLGAPNEIVAAQDPENAVQQTVIAASRVLRAAVQTGVERFIYLSTAHVYGAPLVGHIDEQRVPRPIHAYAIGHRAAEDLVLAAHDRKQVLGIVIRLSNSFGAPASREVDRWSLVGNDLCRQAVMSDGLTLTSSGVQHRDFIPMTDVVTAIRHFMDLPGERLANGLFNLGGECSLSIYDFAKRVADRARVVLNKDLPIRRPAPRDEHASSLDYSIAKLRATGFLPRASFDQELDDALAFCNRAFARAIVS